MKRTYKARLLSSDWEIGNAKRPIGTALMYASTRNAYACQHDSNAYACLDEKIPEYVVMKTIVYKNGLIFNLDTVHAVTTQISERCNIPYQRLMPCMLDSLQRAEKSKAYKTKKGRIIVPGTFRFLDRVCPTGLSFEKAFFKAHEYDVINLQRSTLKTMIKRLNEYEELHLEQAAKEGVLTFP